ncbi:MAG: aminodeoxychorismate synthase component I [Woeseiaceae bacterium]
MTDYAAIERLAAPVDLLRMHESDSRRYPFLLQSTAGAGELGRFDILFASSGESLALSGDGTLQGHSADHKQGFLGALDDWFAEQRASQIDRALPFTGGWFLYLGYELAAEVEPALAMHEDALLPTAFAVRCPAAIVRDRTDDACYLACEYDAGIDIARIRGDVENAAERRARANKRVGQISVTEAPGDDFVAAVQKAKQYIADGDIYQANLSRAWTATLDDTVSATDLYASLCKANPAPFAGIACWNDTTIISSSPERLLRIEDGIASTRPIAGTRPRSSDKDADDSLSAELIAHPKERAEHVMLIDLERNDLGRICAPGSVEVDEMMVLESYAHVHHIVSNVRGKLKSDVSPGEAIAAVFPGGTITGCPKVRCMQIIHELEHEARGAYTGSFGYLNRDGNLDLNILIRTIVMQNNRVSLRAGAGIVADSVPVAELEETRAKAKGMIRALQT